MNNNIILVSIKCAVYNHEHYLRQCLEGFVMQKTNFRFEAIVHDDASTDGSAAIIHEYAEKYPDIIKPIYETENQYSKRDGSLTRIMNAACCGKYIAICEGDDYWIDPLKLQKQVDFLERHSDYGLIYGKARVFNQAQNRYEIRNAGKERKNYEDLLVRGNAIPTLTCVYRKSLLENYSNEITRKWKMGDQPLWLYISHRSKIHYMDEILAVYRKLIHSASSRESYETAGEFIYSSYNCAIYFNELYDSGLKIQIDMNYRKRMFSCAFAYKKWEKALYWYKLGFTKDYKDIIRYIFVRNTYLHKLGSIFINKGVI